MDHFIIEKDSDASRMGCKVGLVVLDLFSKWLQAYPAKSKCAEDTRRGLYKFIGPQQMPDLVYSDNSLEIKKAVKILGWDDRHTTSTPHRPETNGIIESHVGIVKHGTTSLLVQS